MFELRRVREDERDQIAKVWHSSASLPEVGPPQMPSYEVLRVRVDEELASGWVVTVAVDGSELAGFVALRPEERYLAELFVSPSYLGCGLGKRLLKHAKAVMQDGFTLFTTTKNVRARHFYEREGLIQERESLHPRAGHPITYYRWNGSQGLRTLIVGHSRHSSAHPDRGRVT